MHYNLLFKLTKIFHQDCSIQNSKNCILKNKQIFVQEKTYLFAPNLIDFDNYKNISASKVGGNYYVC